jgi:hypothetical protein
MQKEHSGVVRVYRAKQALAVVVKYSCGCFIFAIIIWTIKCKDIYSYYEAQSFYKWMKDKLAFVA